MKKLFSSIFASGLITLSSLPIKADQRAVIIKPGGAGHVIHSFNQATGVTASITDKAFNGGGWKNFFTVDDKLFVVPSSGNDVHVYDFTGDSWTDLSISGSMTSIVDLPLSIYMHPTDTNIDIDSGNIDGTAIGSNSASSGAFTTLSATGNSTVGGTLGVTGATTITGALDANGGASIDNVQIGVSGDNEIDTASGNLTIDSAGGTTTIDDDVIISGTLKVNGREITGESDSAQTSINTNNIKTNKGNINKLGKGIAKATALTAALNALPTVSGDTKLTCGIGTGTYSSSYALGVGCASKVNKRLDINFGGSYVNGGSENYGNGSLDNLIAKAGFVFKIGEIERVNHKNEEISDLELKIKKLSQIKNKNTEQIENLVNLVEKQQKLLAQFSKDNQLLKAKLENIEKIAFEKSEQSHNKLALNEF